MSGWGILARAAICAFGMLVFLTVVAHAINWVAHDVRLKEQRERGDWGRSPERAGGDAQRSSSAAWRHRQDLSRPQTATPPG